MMARSVTVTARLLELAPKLKVVSRHGVWYENIELQTCTRLGIAAELRGLPPMAQWIFADDCFQDFNAEVLKRGGIVCTVCYPSFAHRAADLDAALAAMGEALAALAVG